MHGYTVRDGCSQERTHERSAVTPRVVVTGLGVASPIGIGLGRFWKAALAGLSGVSAISAFEGLPMAQWWAPEWAECSLPNRSTIASIKI